MTKQRTIQQNRALHKYFDNLAEALNDAGMDMKKTLKPEVEIPWNKDMIKRFIWRPIEKATLGKESTTQLETKDINEIYEIINRHMAEKFGVSVPFPSEEEV